MLPRIATRRASLCALFVLPLVVGCGNSSNGDNGDAGADTYDEAFAPPDTGLDLAPPPDTGPTIHCKLDNLTDPVAFCVQKTVFLQWHDIIKGVGIVQSWDSTTFVPDKDSSGKPLHDQRDDVLFAAAATRYLESGHIYGDNEIETQVLADLNAVLPTIETEYATPDASDPELYLELRDVASNLRKIFDAANADKIDAIADAIGRAVYDQLWHELAVVPPPPSDAGDAGTDGATDALSDTSSDTSSGDGPSDAPADVPRVEGILGTASGGGYDYVVSNAAYGAEALIDMVARHPSDPKSLEWQKAAWATFRHLVSSRAQEPATSLPYTELVTSTDPAHDTVAGTTPDELHTDTIAVLALSLSRAQEVVTGNSSSFAPSIQSYTFAIVASDLLNRSESTPIWDADKTGYFEGWSLTSSAAIPRKPTRANALMLAAIHRVYTQFGTTTSAHIKPLKTVVTQTTPVNTSLLSAVADQGSWFVATSPAFDLTGLTDARAKSYFSSANAVACAGLWEQWFGAPK
jgi:hypothetical protein